MSATPADPRAPMAAAPMKYSADGCVDWGNMWDSFCVLAQEGGPPHRASMLYACAESDLSDPDYQAVCAEISRGITAVSGLAATAGPAGWIAISCVSAAQAHWLADAIEQENVQARATASQVLVPAGAAFSLKGEIKNVITAVAKTSHYWQVHMPLEVKQTLMLQR